MNAMDLQKPDKKSKRKKSKGKKLKDADENDVVNAMYGTSETAFAGSEMPQPGAGKIKRPKKKKVRRDKLKN